jgi:transcriptional regulator with XRE-family HTH domain
MDLLDKLIRERKLKRITQQDVAQAIGVNGTTLSRYELRKREMSMSQFILYADAVGFDVKLIMRE